MSIAVGFMTTYIETERARLGFRHNGRGALTTAYRLALLAAWNASKHLGPGGGLMAWANERTPEEQLMSFTWLNTHSSSVDIASIDKRSRVCCVILDYRFD